MVEETPTGWSDRSSELPAVSPTSSDRSPFAHVRMWIHPFTRFHEVPVFKRVWLYVALTGIYTLIVHWLLGPCSQWEALKEANSLGYVSVILGVLLVFRTNAANERWWEGRRVWGQLVNDSRNLAMKVDSLAELRKSEKEEFGTLIISFAYALKHHLRNSTPSSDLPGIEPLSELAGKNIPVHVADKIYAKVSSWRDSGIIDNLELLRLDPHLRAFMDIAGACERIRSTPLAVSYRAFMRQGIAISLLLAPFYISNTGLEIWWKLSIVMLAAYFMVGMEMIAEEIEEPFGKEGDDLPLDTFCLNIRNTVNQVLPT